MEMKMKILVTRELPFDVESALSGHELIYNDKDEPMPYDELCDLIQDVDGVISMLSDQIDENLLSIASNLKVIANYAVGYNNIDTEAAKKRGIQVFNTPDVLTETTAELGFTLMMAVARRVVESDAYARSGAFEGWGPSLFLGTDLYGKTLGIYGFGRIGQAVARCASGFHMNVIYHNRSRKFGEELLLGATQVGFDELLLRSDFLVVAAPLNEESMYRFGLREFERMKKTAVFVNIGRGQIVREEELAEALREDEIFGAGLDVFEKEPEIHSDLYDLDNVVMLPHIGSASVATRSKMAALCVNSVLAALSNKEEYLSNRVC